MKEFSSKTRVLLSEKGWQYLANRILQQAKPSPNQKGTKALPPNGLLQKQPCSDEQYNPSALPVRASHLHD
jgi:hypothetical protein